MKTKRTNTGALKVFLIFWFLVEIISFNITQDWATALFLGLGAGFFSAFIYSVGYSIGFEKGDYSGYGKGYETALKDINPALPPEIQKVQNE